MKNWFRAVGGVLKTLAAIAFVGIGRVDRPAVEARRVADKVRLGRIIRISEEGRIQGVIPGALLGPDLHLKEARTGIGHVISRIGCSDGEKGGGGCDPK